MLLFKDILTFLGLDYRDASLITLYLNVLRISTEYSVNQMNRIFLTFKTIICCHKIKKSACYKWMYGLSGNDYRVAVLSKSYLTVVEISMKSLRSIGQF